MLFTCRFRPRSACSARSTGGHLQRDYAGPGVVPFQILHLRVFYIYNGPHLVSPFTAGVGGVVGSGPSAVTCAQIFGDQRLIKGSSAKCLAVQLGKEHTIADSSKKRENKQMLHHIVFTRSGEQLAGQNSLVDMCKLPWI